MWSHRCTSILHRNLPMIVMVLRPPALSRVGLRYQRLTSLASSQHAVNWYRVSGIRT